MARRLPLITFLVLSFGLFAPAWSAEETHDASHHGEAAVAHGEEHGHEDEHSGHTPAVPDILLLIQNQLDPRSSGYKLIHLVHGPFFSLLIAGLIVFYFWKVTRNIEKVPGRAQAFVEFLVETLHNFICSILGKEMGHRYFPFLATLFVYILCMNLSALVPGFHAPTATPMQTFGLSILVFFYVQFSAFRFLGPGGYLYHLMGEPKEMVEWCLVPIFFPLHVIGELIKPLSLGLRLWGNILGEDILLGVFAAFGLVFIPALTGIVGWNMEAAWIGIPLHLLVVPLVLIGSSVQALIFMTLSTIYISLVLPHAEHEEAHA